MARQTCLTATGRGLRIAVAAMLLLGLASAGPAAYVLCQQPTSDPLEGCPRGTILVRPSESVQSAIAALPRDASPQVILILPGHYTEQLDVKRPGPTALLGQTAHPTNRKRNRVRIAWAAAVVKGGHADAASTAVLTVAPVLGARRAAPADDFYGCKRFSAYNIDFSNDYAHSAVGPSLVVSLTYANAGFYWCGIYGYQDTAPGLADAHAGFGTAWLQNVDITLRGCGGGITAWKGQSTSSANKYGVYVSDSRVGAANASVGAAIAATCYLGRPWNDLHRSVFFNTWLDGSIAPAGYSTWNNAPSGAPGSRYGIGTFMAEYGGKGPGFDLRGRQAGRVTRVLTSDEVGPYRTPEHVFTTWKGEQPNIEWIDPAAYIW
ncbi:hypothetical protein UVI_02024390 [Ustilaginoidea virens]|uniref:pectinesterase n=1 Tax=Ustilaginoidea virens TaxID=1159556 RepID=A0A1B5KQV9_USTVR|nr:hypothetical protein UVI_02024390 [Ustilaginoidea virens]